MSLPPKRSLSKAFLEYERQSRDLSTSLLFSATKSQQAGIGVLTPKQAKKEKKKEELKKRLTVSKKSKTPRKTIVNIADQCVSRVLTIQDATVEIQEDYFANSGRQNSEMPFRKSKENVEEIEEEKQQSPD